MNVGWVRLVDSENNIIVVKATHIAMILPLYTETKFAELKQPSPSQCNILIGGNFFTIQGSMDLIQTLVSQALSQIGIEEAAKLAASGNKTVGLRGVPQTKIQLLSKEEKEN